MEIDCIGTVAGVFQNPHITAGFYFFPAFEAYIVFIENYVFGYLYIKLTVFFPAPPAGFAKQMAFLVIRIYPAENPVKVKRISGIFDVLYRKPQL
jgi:hypothetical protein